MQRRCATLSVQTLRGRPLAPARAPVARGPRQPARSATNPLPAAAVRTTLVGIDLGTSNSAISVIDKGRSCVLADEQGVAVTPSIVSYTQDGVIVGAAALGADPANTFYSVKRLIGRTPAEVAADLGALRYRVVAGEREGDSAGGHGGGGPGNGSVRLCCPVLGRTLAPEEVSAELLRHLLARAEAHLGAVRTAVVTVPAHFGDAQRKAMYSAAKLAGLQAVTLLQEPVAAAIAYGLGKPEDADTILVVDLGGGTLDVSILESFEGIIEVLTTDGDPKLGGDDFDRAIAQWALQAVRARGHDISDARLAAVMPAAEAAKVALSTADEATVSVLLPDGHRCDVRLTRDGFDALIEPLLRRIWAPLKRAGSSVFLEWAARPFDDQGAACTSDRSDAAVLGRFAPPPRRITKALLVGGKSRVSAVQRLVQHVTGVTPDASLDPELCVAIGAGIQPALELCVATGAGIRARLHAPVVDPGAEAGILEGILDGPLEVMDGAYVQQLHGRATGTAGFEAV